MERRNFIKAAGLIPALLAACSPARRATAAPMLSVQDGPINWQFPGGTQTAAQIYTDTSSGGTGEAGHLILQANTDGDTSAPLPSVTMQATEPVTDESVKLRLNAEGLYLFGEPGVLETPPITLPNRTSHPDAPATGQVQLYSYNGAWYQQGSSGGPKRILTEDDL